MQHPDSQLTLRAAFERHYDTSELAKTTQKWYRYTINKWDELTENPPVGEIDNDTLATFRQRALEAGFTGKTVNNLWTALRAIFRRLGPVFSGNPLGRGIIAAVPYMKRVRVLRVSPVRIPLDDISKFYVAAKTAQFPRHNAYPACHWWQALVVVAFYTGLRRGDLFRIKPDDIDLDAGVLYCESGKTMKADEFPLPAVAVEHLRRIWEPHREFVFLSYGSNAWGGAFNRRFREICDHAKITPFTLKDLRSTAASEAERIRPGAASMLLQHARHDVTGRHYLSLADVLRDVVEQMPVPLPFKHGINLDLKAREQKRKEIVRMLPREYETPKRPDPAEWRFEPDAFSFRGTWYSLMGAPWRVLKTLALADGPVDLQDVATAVWGNRAWPREYHRVSGRVCGVVSVVRRKLRHALRLSDDWNPVCCTERGSGGKWSLLFPPLPSNGRASA